MAAPPQGGGLRHSPLGADVWGQDCGQQPENGAEDLGRPTEQAQQQREKCWRCGGDRGPACWTGVVGTPRCGTDGGTCRVPCVVHGEEQKALPGTPCPRSMAAGHPRMRGPGADRRHCREQDRRCLGQLVEVGPAADVTVSRADSPTWRTACALGWAVSSVSGSSHWGLQGAWGPPVAEGNRRFGEAQKWRGKGSFCNSDIISEQVTS